MGRLVGAALFFCLLAFRSLRGGECLRGARFPC